MLRLQKIVEKLVKHPNSFALKIHLIHCWSPKVLVDTLKPLYTSRAKDRTFADFISAFCLLSKLIKPHVTVKIKRHNAKDPRLISLMGQ